MRGWLAVGSLMLVAGSWRLWTPQQLFPRVPLWAFALQWTDLIDQVLTWILLAAWILSTALLAWPTLSAASARIASCGYLLLFGALVILDQHRLQPWGVHIAVCLLMVTAFEKRPMLSWLLAFTASIYIYSALSKLDAQFMYTVGQDFLEQLMQVLPGSYRALPEQARVAAAFLFPLGELLCGIGLLWSPVRQLALCLSMVMHATLIAILGPWGLAHSWGVLLWNAVFSGMDGLMWRELRRGQSQSVFQWTWYEPTGDSPMLSRYRRGVLGLCLVALVLPLGERWGVVDHWLGWALYAPHSSRARIELLAGNAERLPTSVQPFVSRPTEEITAWETVSVEQWSLESLGVPIYPQQRFYVAAARAIAESVDEFGVQVTLLGTANRWSGRREYRVLHDRGELQQAGERYWFNTRPRW